MPQRGVTLAEVEEASASLLASGRVVSTRNVRRALGDRGSLTTIGAHLRDIRAREEEQRILAGTAPGPPMPDAVIQGLMLGARKHWEALNDAAEAIIDQARTEAAAQVQTARDAEQAATTESAAARAAQATAATALAETQAELEAFRTAHATLGEEHRSLATAQALTLERQRGAESLAEERRATLDTLTARLERTTTELGDARDALQRARTEADLRERGLIGRLAAEEGKSKEAEQALAHARERLSDTERRLEQARSEGIAMGRALEETRQALDAERSEHAATARDLATHRERCDGLGTALAQSQDHARSLGAMLDGATERAAAAEAALRAAQAVEARDRRDCDDGVGAPSR